MIWTAPTLPLTDEPFTGDERAMLEGFLDWHRATLLNRCAGLTGEQLARRSAQPSTLSLLGLVRHLTEVERTWFRRRFLGQNLEALYWRSERPEAAFDEIDPGQAEVAITNLIGEWGVCRQAVAAASLDATFASEHWGAMSLRWVYLHMIREYALHNGHADLLRERIDGVTS